MSSCRHEVIKSPSQAYVAGSTLRFSGNVPRTGPNGGRYVIDKINLCVAFSDLNNASAAVEGEDVWRAIDRVVVQQHDGVERINLTGDELRVYDYDVMGPAFVPEYADIAAANDQALTYLFPVPFAKPESAAEGDAYALPVDVLKEIRVTCAVPGTMSVGGTVTIDGATYYLEYHLREEMYVEGKMVDIVRSDAFPALAGMTLRTGGRLQGLILHARAASGGAALGSTFTDIRIDRLMTEARTRQELIADWIQAKGNALNDPGTDGGAVRNDPFGAVRAVPVIYADKYTSSWDGFLEAELQIKTTMSQTSMVAISRVVVPPSDAVNRAVEKLWSLPAGALERPKSPGLGMKAGPWVERRAPLVRRGLQR
jgi:hypothetical protein